MATSTESSGGISFFSLLFILFLGLKLAKVISWSWWWVTAPLWGPCAVALLILLVVLLTAMIVGD
jgi:hypothetical protein